MKGAIAIKLRQWPYWTAFRVIHVFQGVDRITNQGNLKLAVYHQEIILCIHYTFYNIYYIYKKVYIKITYFQVFFIYFFTLFYHTNKMEHIFSSYQSTLDSLVFDTVIEPNNNKPLDMETKANLELWVCNFYLI